MCKAFEDMRLEGYEQGMAEGITKLVKTARNLGATKLAACEQLVQQYALKEDEASEKIEMFGRMKKNIINRLPQDRQKRVEETIDGEFYIERVVMI